MHIISYCCPAFVYANLCMQRSGLDVGFSFSGPGFEFATPELQLRTDEVFRSGSEVFPASTVSEHFCSGNGSEQFGTLRVTPSFLARSPAAAFGTFLDLPTLAVPRFHTSSYHNQISY